MIVNNHGKFEVGDLVKKADGGEFRSGCCVDHVGVVIQSNPLQFTTEDGDMLWTASVNDWELIAIGKANSNELQKAMRRLK